MNSATDRAVSKVFANQGKCRQTLVKRQNMQMLAKKHKMTIKRMSASGPGSSGGGGAGLLHGQHELCTHLLRAKPSGSPSESSSAHGAATGESQIKARSGR